jgi:hypothetical protein
VVYVEHLLFFRISWILGCASQKVPMWSNPSKNFDYWISNELSWKTTFHMYCHNSLLRKLSTSLGCVWLHTLGSLCLVSSKLCTIAFSLCCCFGSFHCYKFVVLSPASKSWNTGVTLQTPDTRWREVYRQYLQPWQTYLLQLLEDKP